MNKAFVGAVDIVFARVAKTWLILMPIISAGKGKVEPHTICKVTYAALPQQVAIKAGGHVGVKVLVWQAETYFVRENLVVALGWYVGSHTAEIVEATGKFVVEQSEINTRIYNVGVHPCDIGYR